MTVSMREKHQKVKSLLGDEDILQMITEYLRSVGYNVTVREFKAYIKQDEFRVEKKNVYYDGHERPDVIEYRQEFLHEISELENGCQNR
ncbi:hypothetical protein RirG_051980 [Rhizophagus irregularis DAOM 197198w]|uniref:Uncharacterized protein n=2 Tax=Rhizophagus irregularis TaxID=588596 RepID=A0A015JXS7_RHIIW|nr:hypothetical protein RirG_051980 [Rhizophagus irregularis DAOM 197198w]